MKSKILAMITALGLTLTVGSAFAAGELHIYNWGNYTSPEMIEKFEKMHGIKVTLDGYDSNETMLAKVEQGGSGYDVVVPRRLYDRYHAQEGPARARRAQQDVQF